MLKRRIVLQQYWAMTSLDKVRIKVNYIYWYTFCNNSVSVTYVRSLSRTEITVSSLTSSSSAGLWVHIGINFLLVDYLAGTVALKSDEFETYFKFRWQQFFKI